MAADNLETGFQTKPGQAWVWMSTYEAIPIFPQQMEDWRKSRDDLYEENCVCDREPLACVSCPGKVIHGFRCPDPFDKDHTNKVVAAASKKE